MDGATMDRKQRTADRRSMRRLVRRISPNYPDMNDMKMNIAGTIKIGHEAAKSYATITNTGEIEITGTGEEIRQCIEKTPPHFKFAGHLVLEIMRLRRALDSANANVDAPPPKTPNQTES